MTQEMIDLSLKGINYRRKEIVQRMKEINTSIGYPLPQDEEEYEALKRELYKLDYQAIEIKEQVAE